MIVEIPHKLLLTNPCSFLSTSIPSVFRTASYSPSSSTRNEKRTAMSSLLFYRQQSHVSLTRNTHRCATQTSQALSGCELAVQERTRMWHPAGTFCLSYFSLGLFCAVNRPLFFCIKELPWVQYVDSSRPQHLTTGHSLTC